MKKIDDKTCEFTNMVHSSATPELMDFLGKQGIPWKVFQAARSQCHCDHNEVAKLSATLLDHKGDKEMTQSRRQP